MLKPSPRTTIRIALAAGLLLLFILHTARVLPLGLVDQLERASYDARVVLSLPGGLDPNVVVIDIDEKSINTEGQWPWSRDKLAMLVKQSFEHYGVKVMGFDIVFPEPDKRTGLDTLTRLAQGPLADLPGFAQRVETLRPQLDFDAQFGQALVGKNVVLGYVFKDPTAPGAALSVGLLPAPLLSAQAIAPLRVPFFDYAGYTANLALIQQGSAWGGYFDNSQGVDDDGIFRRVPMVQRYQGALYPSLALEMARLALGAPPLQFAFDDPSQPTGENLEAIQLGKLSIPVDGSGSAMVPYRGRWPAFNYIAASDIIRGSADPALLKGKIALLGTTAPGLLDLRTTPVGKAYPGVEVHANLVAGILQNRVKHRPAYYDGMLVLMLLGIGGIMAFVASRYTPLASGAVALALMALITGQALLAFSSGNLILPLGTPVLFTLALFLLLSFYGYFLEARKVRDVSKQFGEYIPPELVSELASNPAAASMEGEKRVMTVLFSDVRGFTSISEKLDSKELTTLMNAFLTPLTKVIQGHRGTIDKYMGDAVMAFWGAPLPDAQHASHALDAAREMLKAVRGLDAAFEAKGWPKLHIGVGLNTGEMVVGNMGSEFRRAYTVMGDAVNLGSRLEGLTKEYGVELLVSESTKAAGPADWAWRELDLVKVKGKNEPVAIFEPLGPKAELSTTLLNDLSRQRAAFKLYRAQAWDKAEVEYLNLSRSAQPHKVYAVFLERIQYLRDHPPGMDWDGSFAFKTK